MADPVVLTQEEWELVEKRLVRTQYLESIVPYVVPTVPMGNKAISLSFTKIIDPLASDHQMWSVANIAIKDGASVGFDKEVENVFRCQLTGVLPAFDLETSRNEHEPLDAVTFERLAELISQEEEKFNFSGAKPKGGRAASGSLTEGLTGKAGNTSTENTATLTTAGQFVITVADMLEQNRQDNQVGRTELITNSRTYKYLWELLSTNAGIFEFTTVKELLQGGNIWYTAGLQNPTAADDATLLALVSKATNFRQKKIPIGVKLGAYDPMTDGFPFRIESYHWLGVYQANSICKHVTVDIA